MTIRCEIVSQDRMVFEGEADMVILPGAEGEMGILPNHAPLLSTLKYGIVKVRHEGKEDVFTVAGGIVDVLPSRVVILTDAAENVDEINIARAEAARKRAEELLHTGIPHDTDEYLRIEAALKRSNLRLDAVKKYRGPIKQSYTREES